MFVAVFSIALLAVSAVPVMPESSDATPGKVTVVLSTSPDGAGRVTGRGEYDYGAHVQITASAYEGYEFLGWQDGPKGASRWITLPNQTRTFEYTAEFKAIPKYEVDVRVKGDVGGFTEVICDNQLFSGKADFFLGSEVTIRGIAHKDYQFVKWSDGSKQWERTITVNSPMTFIAEFELINKPDTGGGLGLSFIWVILGIFGATAVVSFVFFEYLDRKKKRNQEE
ncbi:MAG: hypothetical protein LBT41_05310 [Candidatus Methanoplasma sp.]|nr:hypothetical protein [Candidatus Methanoplasma sp.]